MAPRTSPRAAACTLAVLAALALHARPATADAPQDVFTARLDARSLTDVVAAGYDVASARPAPGGGATVDLVLSAAERAALSARGVALSPARDAHGRTWREAARAQQEEGYKVWRPFDGPSGVLAEERRLADERPDLVDLEVLGTSVQDRDIVALRVTAGPDRVPPGSRPAAVFMSAQHGREWIGLEVNRRLLHHLVDSYGVDPSVTALLDTTEVWFVLAANPDGYQRTFDAERMWRKNVRDNNADGQIGDGDGVDLNRNFDTHWGYDDMGSSADPANETYRGPSAASEPETRAVQDLVRRLRPAFLVNWHSVASLILYPEGWQDQTPTADDPIFRALAGSPDRPAIDGFVPTLSAGLYATNGETCDFAYDVGTLCFTPELSDQGSGGGFVFPDDEALVARELERVLPFALDVAGSAADPESPRSHLGLVPPGLVTTPFDVSYGDPQVVGVDAAKRLGAVTAHYRVGDGPERTVPTGERPAGERYGRQGHHYRRLQAEVTGASPGDEVMVWFEGGGQSTAPFTYRLESDTGAPVLILAAEDYRGALPTVPGRTGPVHLAAYRDVLDDLRIAADVYDVDAHGGRAPTYDGVLRHHRAVVWYTGDDVLPRSAEMQPGTVSRQANDLQLALRDFLNGGGRLVVAGTHALYRFDTYPEYDPANDAACGLAGRPVTCEVIRPDFARYYLGVDASRRSSTAALDPENMAGAGRGFHAGGEGGSDAALATALDLSGAASARLTLDAYWNLEDGTDFGSVEVSIAGGEWHALPDEGGRTVSGAGDPSRPEWGVTGVGRGRLVFDLSAFVGETVQLRLRCRTDRFRTYAGWFVDDLVVVADDRTIVAADGEDGFGSWSADGWSVVPGSPRPDELVLPVIGLREPVAGLSWSFGAPGGARQDEVTSFVPTSAALPEAEYPQFASRVVAWSDDPARRPHGGEYAADAGGAQYSFQRLSRTIAVGDGPAELAFWLSYDFRSPYDALFLEARTAGADDWTTLPERGGATSADVARMCATASWFGRFPRLARYMTPEGEAGSRTCRPAGTSGVWQAANDRSDGWVRWSFDLSSWRGREVEVSISVVTSREPSGAVLVDDVTSPDGTVATFEDGWDGWTVLGSPEGSRVTNAVEFTRGRLVDRAVGPVVVTGDTVTFGFGLEGVADAEARRELLGRALAYLGVTAPERSIVWLPLAGR